MGRWQVRLRPRRSDAIEKGVTLSGFVLCDRIAGDEFSSLWTTEPATGDAADTCVRVIPVAPTAT